MKGGPGVYQLFLGETLVYVGKADRNVAKRLKQHLWKLSGRSHVSVEELGFKALYIHRNWAPSVHESVLIEVYRGRGESEWNTSGFGNNDPGRRRDQTVTEATHFDSRYPIDPAFVPELIQAADHNALQLLLRLKKSLPYIFRFETKYRKKYQQGSPKYNGLVVRVPRNGMTTRQLIQEILDSFPEGWQATFLLGRLILYEEHEEYPHAIATVRRH